MQTRYFFDLGKPLFAFTLLSGLFVETRYCHQYYVRLGNDQILDSWKWKSVELLYCSLPPFLFSLSLSISHSISTNQMSNDGLHWQLFLSTNTRRVAAEQCHWKRTHFCGRSMTGDIFHKSENRYEQGQCAVPLRKAFYHWWHAIFIYLRIINAGIHNSFPYYKFHSSLLLLLYQYNEDFVL